MMNDLPREILKYLIGQYGRSIAEDPKRCEALLRDFCGQYRKEINVLVSAIKESVPADLSNSQNRVPSTLLLAQLTKRLEDYLAIDREAARWAVESWAIALGLISEKDKRVVEESVNSESPRQESSTTQAVNSQPPRQESSTTQAVNNSSESNRTSTQSVVIDPIFTVNSNVRLFTQNQVRVATLFGGILAGSILMALNHKRTGQKIKAKQCFLIGLIPNIIADLLMFFINADIAGTFLGYILFPNIYVAHRWYNKSQGALFEKHLLNGGKKASWWTVLFVVTQSILLILPSLNLLMLLVSIIGGDKF
jgi:hypothetical protein